MYGTKSISNAALLTVLQEKKHKVLTSNQAQMRMTHFTNAMRHSRLIIVHVVPISVNKLQAS